MSQALQEKMKHRIDALTWISFVSLCWIPILSQGASFDCTQAKSFAEKNICSDPELSKLDDELAVKYREALNKNSNPKYIQTEQREWLRQRNICSNIICLSKVYTLRMAQLQKIPVHSGNDKIASTAQAGKKSKLRTYKPHPGDCYVQLKPTGNEQPYIRGGDYPVCRVVLENLNKFCNEPPQYNRRKLHSTTKNLEEPNWQPLIPKENMDIVEATFTAVGNSVEEREARWSQEKDRMTMLAEKNLLRLSFAEIDIDSNEKTETVYMLENSYPDDPAENNSPVFMVANKDGRGQSEINRRVGYEAYGDLWRSPDEFGVNRWHSISLLSIQPQNAFFVYELVRPTIAPMGAVVRCTIQHIKDYKNN